VKRGGEKSCVFLIVLLLIAMITTGCQIAQGAKQDDNTVRVGYFPNLTHLPAIVAIEKGFFQEELGSAIKLETVTFTSGGLFMEGLYTNQIDFGYTGPGPAMNVYVKNPGHEIVSGAVNGGSVFLVRSDAGINSIKDLANKRIAIPGIGNTQDLMVQKVLREHGLGTKGKDGNVQIMTQAPADTSTLFSQKNVDGAAVPEPWGVQITKKAGGKVLLDWDEFAWGKEAPSTVVVAKKSFSQSSPQLVEKLLKAHSRAVAYTKEHPDEAVAIFRDHIKRLTNKELSLADIQEASKRLEVTTSLKTEVLQEMAETSKAAGYIPKSNIDGLVNLKYLQAIKQ